MPSNRRFQAEALANVIGWLNEAVSLMFVAQPRDNHLKLPALPFPLSSSRTTPLL